VILSDKTGTLTQNRMSVRRLWLGGEFFKPDDIAVQPRLAEDHRALFECCALPQPETGEVHECCCFSSFTVMASSLRG
jgi:magnesium-transporting ATPase (P-type)